jgi:hypothetical protein
MGLLDFLKSLVVKGGPTPPSPRRLDGRSKTLLAASIKLMPADVPGFITMHEAKTLFSPAEDDYAFGEMDEVGKSNLAAFVAGEAPGCQFEFMPVEGRLYFMRNAAHEAG